MYGYLFKVNLLWKYVISQLKSSVNWFGYVGREGSRGELCCVCGCPWQSEEEGAEKGYQWGIVPLLKRDGDRVRLREQYRESIETIRPNEEAKGQGSYCALLLSSVHFLTLLCAPLSSVRLVRVLDCQSVTRPLRYFITVCLMAGPLVHLYLYLSVNFLLIVVLLRSK